MGGGEQGSGGGGEQGIAAGGGVGAVVGGGFGAVVGGGVGAVVGRGQDIVPGIVKQYSKKRSLHSALPRTKAGQIEHRAMGRGRTSKGKGTPPLS